MVELYKNLQNTPVLLWAIPSDEFLHPCVTDISLVFIKDIQSKKTYCISFNHPDMKRTITKEQFIKELNDNTEVKWVLDKKTFVQLLPESTNLLDFNLWNHINTGTTIDKCRLETTAHRYIYRSKRKCGDLNNVVPLVKHTETFEKICDEFFRILETINVKIDEGFKKENDVILDTLTELESNGIYVNGECFSKHFNATIQPSGLVYSQYNIYTSTGRPSNNFDNVNYAALNKDNGARSCFVSRFGDDGMMVLIDYSAFHPRIICNLVGFDISIDEDIYKYLGKLYFKRDVTEYDMAEIKSITMRQLYGGVEEKYKQIKYFTTLNKFIDFNWKQFQSDGYVMTPIFKRRITNDHLKDANPNKLFNYILQATETEISMTAIKVVNEHLKDKKSKAVLYTYDSLLFDIHKDDGAETLANIIEIMKMGNRFPVKVYLGTSYNSVVQIYP